MKSVKPNYFLPQYFRVVLNQLGLKASPQDVKAPKAAKVPPFRLQFAKQSLLIHSPFLSELSARVLKFSQIHYQLDLISTHVSILRLILFLWSSFRGHCQGFRNNPTSAYCFQLANLILELLCSVVQCRGFCTSSFQVREARVSYFKRIFACVWVLLCIYGDCIVLV